MFQSQRLINALTEQVSKEVLWYARAVVLSSCVQLLS
jgi:hypothetical protein